jgi:hypothetical protein
MIQPAPTPEQREEIEEAKTRQETCGEYLRLTLRDGPAEVRVVKAELGKAGFSTRTVEQAARNLGVELRRAVEGGRTVYLWEPDDAAKASGTEE